jgi:hypothetical protein
MKKGNSRESFKFPSKKGYRFVKKNEVKPIGTEGAKPGIAFVGIRNKT